MRLMFALAQLLACSSIALAAAVHRRQTGISSWHGTINTPLNGAAVAPGETFAFDYTPVNLCESGYSPIAAYLLGQPAADTPLTASGQVVENSYVYEFGNYTIANFGLPPMSPPPASFVMPDISVSTEAGTTLYFAVVETYMYCPGDVYEEFAITGNNILYGA